MLNQLNISKLVEYHLGYAKFDYNQCVDWACNMLEDGCELESVMILASFVKPVDRNEIRPYLREALNDLGMEEKESDESLKGLIALLLEELTNSKDIRNDLTFMYRMYLEVDEDVLFPFYLLYHSWDDLEELEFDCHFEGVDLNNIENVIRDEARKALKELKNE